MWATPGTGDHTAQEQHVKNSQQLNLIGRCAADAGGVLSAFAHTLSPLAMFAKTACACSLLPSVAVQELERMRQQAAMQEPAQVEQASYETSYQAEYQAKTMEGLQ